MPPVLARAGPSSLQVSITVPSCCSRRRQRLRGCCSDRLLAAECRHLISRCISTWKWLATSSLVPAVFLLTVGHVGTLAGVPQWLLEECRVPVLHVGTRDGHCNKRNVEASRNCGSSCVCAIDLTGGWRKPTALPHMCVSQLSTCHSSEEPSSVMLHQMPPAWQHTVDLFLSFDHHLDSSGDALKPL